MTLALEVQLYKEIHSSRLTHLLKRPSWSLHSWCSTWKAGFSSSRAGKCVEVDLTRLTQRFAKAESN